jgi:hypothetical protein
MKAALGKLFHSRTSVRSPLWHHILNVMATSWEALKDPTPWLFLQESFIFPAWIYFSQKSYNSLMRQLTEFITFNTFLLLWQRISSGSIGFKFYPCYGLAE